MPIDYLAEFPISAAILPQRLRALLEPAALDADARIDVAERYEADPYGPGREHVFLAMAIVPEAQLNDLKLLNESSSGLVEFSTPVVDAKGGLDGRRPSISGFDYIVAAWGDSSWYSYNLAEAVWMTLGLTPRCIGNNAQQLVFDDLSKPELGIADGEVASAYYYTSQRNIRWRMRNDYLRQLLWMRGAWGVRAFYYEAAIPDGPALRALMGERAHVVFAPIDGWYEIDLREFNGQLLLQVSATVAAVSPDRCEEPTADGLLWPTFEGPITHHSADALVGVHLVYLDDRFLERYEQDTIFDSHPTQIHDRWHCSPSYRGQWAFTDCVRVDRNAIKVPMRELYKPKPDREILHAHHYAMTSEQVAQLNPDAEPIVGKVQRLAKALTALGEWLAWLAAATTGEKFRAEQFFKLSAAELNANGWLAYPELCRLGQVAPLDMSQQAFLSRCKSLFELWNRLPVGAIRRILIAAGNRQADVQGLGSLKLIQALLNQLERMNGHLERVEAFAGGADLNDLTRRNPRLVGLFTANDLRIADAHELRDKLPAAMAVLQIDMAELNQGYGTTLDAVFDAFIDSVEAVNDELSALADR